LELLKMTSNQAHILVVDDGEDLREMFAYYLTRKGLRVSKARDGKEGLEKAFGLMPDLVLLDLWLPEISGWEVLHRLKSDARTKHIPVLILTGYTMAPPLECDGFLTKPFQLAALDAEITHRLNAPNLVSLRRPV
jgi:two-component system cell cycle response regulator DivK